MKQEGLVSIITPSYNTGKYILETITSVKNQTYKNWEMIIVDDCSSDNTKSILDKLEDCRIRVYYNSENKGAAYCRNKALKLAKGQWIAFLDSDDLWYPDKLEKQLEFMKGNNYYFSYTKYCEIDQAGNELGKIVSGPKKITKHGMYNYCWPGCLTVMYETDKIGLIQIDNIKKNNDYAMWLKISNKTNCYLLDQVCAKYRKGRTNSISNQSVIKLIKWHYILFNEVEHFNKIQSLYYTIMNLFYGIIKKLVYVKRRKRN